MILPLFLILLTLVLSIFIDESFSEESQIKKFDTDISAILNEISTIEASLNSITSFNNISQKLESSHILLKSSFASTDPKDEFMTKNVIEKLVLLQQKFISIQNISDKIIDSGIDSDEYIHLQNIKNISESYEKDILEFMSKIYSMDDAKPKLFTSVKQINLVYYIDEGFKDEKQQNSSDMGFQIVNLSSIPPKNLKVFATELINKDEVRFVGSMDSKYSNVGWTTRQHSNGNIFVDYKSVRDDMQKFTDEGTYVGQISIVGDNFDTISLDVEIIVKQNPWNLLSLTIAGMISAASIGLAFTWRDKIIEYRKSMSDDSSIIKEVNAYINRWNNISHHIDEVYWNSLSDMASKEIKIIQDKRDEVDLNKDLTSVMWFKRTDPIVDQHVLQEKHAQPKTPLPTILKPNEKEIPIERQQEFNKMKKARESKKKQHIFKKIKEDFIDTKKIFYFISAGLISIPTTVFMVDSFVGLKEINYIISFATGFGIYRVQDIKNAFFPKS